MSSNKFFHFYLLALAFVLLSCGIRKDVYEARKKEVANIANTGSKENPKYIYGEHIPDDLPSKKTIKGNFNTPLTINRQDFIQYANTLIGTPYLYGSTDKNKGLDCSGFVYTVFDHFNIKAPRSSKDFTNEGKEVKIEDAQPGDLILFTNRSTQSKGEVGHIGIIIQSYPHLKFIHSSSGKRKGVVISDFSGYYVRHFVKVIAVLK